jgi:hypothetical protein
MTYTMQTADAVVAMDDTALRSYCVERLTSKWGESERSGNEAHVAGMSRAKLMQDLMVDYEDARSLRALKASAKVSGLSASERRAHYQAG